MVRKGKKSVCFNGRRCAEVCSNGRTRPENYKKEKTVDFPFDIMMEILSRLPVEALMRSKSVCKSWYTLISHPDFIDLQRNKASGQPFRIILRSECPYGVRTKLFLVDIVEGNWKCKEIPIDIKTHAVDYDIVGSCNGLLCIGPTECRGGGIGGLLYICNPITGECEILADPRCDGYGIDDTRFLFGFGFDSISKKYKVICVYRRPYYDSDYIEGNLSEEDLATRGVITTVGEGCWRKLELPYNVVYNNTVFLKGAFHWMIEEDARSSGSERILALNISTEEFYAIKFPPSFMLNFEYLACLIIFEDSLMIVESDELHNVFRVWKILRSQTNGELVDEYTCQLSPGITDEYCCRMIGMLRDGNFVFHATRKIHRGKIRKKSPCGHRLAIYDRRKKCSFIREIFGAPSHFRIHMFVPTLLSSCLQIGKEEPEKRYHTKKASMKTAVNENEIRITSQGRIHKYITYATSLLQHKGFIEIVFKAMGRAINKTIMIVELIKRRIVGLHQSTSIGSIDITNRRVSMISITLSKLELDTSLVGYQPPLHAVVGWD